MAALNWCEGRCGVGLSAGYSKLFWHDFFGQAAASIQPHVAMPASRKRLCDATPEAAEGKKRGRAAAVLTVEARAAKALRDNFKESQGWAKEMLYMRRVDNVTVYETVLQNLRLREAKHADAQVMGGKYYRNIKDTFRPPNDPRQHLAVPNPPHPINPALLRAMILAKRSHPDHMGMVSCLTTLNSLNATENVGVVKWALGLNVRCQKQLPAGIAFCKYVVRVQYEKQFPREFDLLGGFFNEVVTAWWLRFRGKRQLPGKHTSLPTDVGKKDRAIRGRRVRKTNDDCLK